VVSVSSPPNDQDYLRYNVGTGKWDPFPSVNWCEVAIGPSPPALTVASSGWNIHSADLSITTQSGADFSVGDSGNIITAGGGRFQASLYIPGYSPGDSTFDGGSTDLRWLGAGLSINNSHDDLSRMGIDVFVPLLLNNPNAVNALSTMGLSAPGEDCAHTIFLFLANGFGTDSITPLLPTMLIWQV
jgi:hypothetical protein